MSETLDQGELHAKAENLNFELSDGTTAQNLLLQTIVHMDSTPDAATHRSGFSVAQLDVETLKQFASFRSLSQSGSRFDSHARSFRPPSPTSRCRGSVRPEIHRTGALKPTSRLNGRAQFSRRRQIDLSGFENLSGSLEVANKHGHVSFATKKGAVSIPGRFLKLRVYRWILSPVPSTGS